jgi:hypothetical protein
MQDNNIVISEVQRIKTIMTRHLLTESYVSLATDVVSKFSSKVGRVSSNFDNLFNQLRNVTSDNDAITIIAKLCDESDELLQYVAPKVLATLNSQEQQLISSLKTSFGDLIRNGADVNAVKSNTDNWIETNVNTQFTGVKDILKKEVSDYMDEVAKQVTQGAGASTRAAAKKWTDLRPLTQQELRELEKLYRAKGLGSYFKNMRKFATGVSDMMKSQDELIDETLRMIKTLDGQTDGEVITNLLSKIGDNLTTLTNKDKTNFKVIDNWIDVNVPNYKLKSMVSSEEGYKRAASLLDGTSLESWKKEYGSLMTRKGKLWSQIAEIVLPWRWFGKSITKYESSRLKKWSKIFTGEEFKEFRRWFLTGQTKGWEGFKKYSKVVGMPQAVFSVGKEWGVSWLSLAFVYGFCDYATDLLGLWLEDATYFKDRDWVKNQAMSWHNSHSSEEKNEMGNTELGKSIGGFTGFLSDMLGYTVSNVADLKVAIPGFTDNIGAMLYSITHKYENRPMTKEEGFKFKEELEELQKKAGEGMEKIKKSAEEKINKGESKLLDTDETPVEKQSETYSGTYGTTLDEFKSFLKSPAGWGNEINDLKTVNTEVINGVKYYIALDTNGKEYFYTYKNGKYIEY